MALSHARARKARKRAVSLLSSRSKPTAQRRTAWGVTADLRRYKGTWVALAGNRVVDHDRDVTQLLARVRRRSQDVVLVAVPKEKVLIV